MKTKYKRIAVFATQGGGEAIREGNDYVFTVVPDWSKDIQVGDYVPEEWGVQYAFDRYELLPKPKRKIESRNSVEGLYLARRRLYNRKHKVRRIHKKKAKLALKGTMRSVSSARINAVMHWVGVDMAREERQAARKAGKPIHFYEGDHLLVVDADGCGGVVQKGNICLMEQSDSTPRERVVVYVLRTRELQLIEKNRFILHKRFIENE